MGFSILEMDGFLLAIPILGVFLSKFGARSIAAAERATIALRDLFQKQFQHAIVENPDIYGLEHAFYIRRNPLLIFPSIVGGGKRGNDANGFGISRNMPYVMMWGWYVAILYSVIDAIVNYRYIGSIFFAR